MFTKLTTSQRIQAGLVLAVAFCMVLGSNRLDQRHFSTIQNTVNSVYKDRVVVQDFIYQLTKIVYQKEAQFYQKEQLAADAKQGQNINKILTDFGKTKLTPKESYRLDNLKLQFSKLDDLENKMGKSTSAPIEDLQRVGQTTIREIKRNLDGLAQIQLTESSQLTQRSNKSLDMNLLLSQLELAFMIIIGIAIIGLMFSPLRTMKLAD